MHSDALLSVVLLVAGRRDGGLAQRRCQLLLERAAAGAAWRRTLQPALARAGLTETGFAVLAVLWARSPGSMTRTAIARAAGLSVPGAADALLRLELSGLVERERPRGRRTALRLTADGVRRIGLALKCYVQAARAVTRGLSPTELDAAIAAAAKIRDAAERLPQVVATAPDSP